MIFDIEKLKVLANNKKEYLDAVLEKSREISIDNGHDMTEFMEEGFFGSNYKNINNMCHCKCCTFEIEIEYFLYKNEEKLYITNFDPDRKCQKS